MKLYLHGHDYKYAAEQMLLVCPPGPENTRGPNLKFGYKREKE